MREQLWAIIAVALLVAVVIMGEQLWAKRARQKTLGATAAPWGEPYILYFTGVNCTACRTHQEPALARLDGVRIDKRDAIEESELAKKFHVYTLPTTVIMSSQGNALHVNYGYAAVSKLERQLAEARTSGMPKVVVPV